MKHMQYTELRQINDHFMHQNKNNMQNRQTYFCDMMTILSTVKYRYPKKSHLPI